MLPRRESQVRSILFAEVTICADLFVNMKRTGAC